MSLTRSCSLPQVCGEALDCRQSQWCPTDSENGYKAALETKNRWTVSAYQYQTQRNNGREKQRETWSQRIRCSFSEQVMSKKIASITFVKSITFTDRSILAAGERWVPSPPVRRLAQKPIEQRGEHATLLRYKCYSPDQESDTTRLNSVPCYSPIYTWWKLVQINPCQQICNKVYSFSIISI